MSLASLIIFLLSLRSQQETTIDALDKATLVVAIIALVLWVIANQPLISMLLLVTIDAIAVIPSARRAWARPLLEKQSLWGLNALRHGISILSIQSFTLINLSNPVVCAISNLIVFLIIVFRKGNKVTLPPQKPADSSS